MKAIDAIYEVLSSAGKPLTIAEITELILSTGLWSTQDKTPDQTVSATLSVHLQKFGEQARFIRVSEGVYGLNPDYSAPLPTPKEEPLTNHEAVSNSQSRTLSFTDSAEYILNHFAEHQPMHYQAITDKALELNLVSTKGLTPAATMYAQIITEIERKKKRGEQPR
jgi:restriction system protein